MTQLFTLILPLLLVLGCTNKGCTDEAAENFDEKAKIDDGNCVYCDCQPFNGVEIEIEGELYQLLTGSITEDLTLSTDKKWLLSGGVFVESGAHLTIEAGTVIYAADDGTIPFLSVLQGGYIQAIGTIENPIVFTTIVKNPSQGEWGGIILNGLAPVQFALEGCFGEGGTGEYGGNNIQDNSGTLSYVRVEYAGKELGTDNRMNGFSFYGCGNGTQLDHLQAYYCKDDGFEFLGGTVNLKHAMATACGDDGFDFAKGWTGLGQFWIAELSELDGDRGIEGDNNDDEYTANPCSNPTLSNLTLIGADDGDEKNQGIKLRSGTKGVFANCIITGFPKCAVYIQHDPTLDNISNGELIFKNSIVDNIQPFMYKNNDGDYLEDFTGFDAPEFANETAMDGSLVGFLSGYVGTSVSGAVNPTTFGSWFDAAEYIGAVHSGSDWTAGWTKAL